MNANDFVTAIRSAQAEGKSAIRGRLNLAVRGVRNVVLVIDGCRNGNKHDIWIDSQSGRKTVGRAYLGSKRNPQHLEGWPERFESIAQ